jgi:FAD:protein FMN transferase
MGTAISLDLRQPWVASDAVDSFFAWLRSVDARFSTYRDDSVVSRLRRREVAPEDVEDDVRTVLKLCAEVGRQSDGVFDAWRSSPDGLDPSGLVKGWSVDEGTRILEAAGARNFCVNAGGDVLAKGEASPGTAWRVGLRHPEQPDRVSGVIVGRDLAVATSGAYERGDHILDPRTSEAPQELLSMTVAGPDLAFADAYATAAFAMGIAGVSWTSSRPGYSGYGVTAEHRVLWTDGFSWLLAGTAGQ